MTLTGWGRVAPSAAEVAEPASPAEAAALLDHAPPRGVIARGLGRSYNNAAQCAGGLVLSTARLNRILSLDPETGLARCEAGVSLEQLMVAGLRHGWFVPVTPGTRYVTVGGALAADVHGKNHFADGSFAQHVTQFSLLLPSGEQRTVTPDGDPGLFWATAGGMGLTGFVTTADIQLKRVGTALVKVHTVRTRDLAETMAVLAEHDKTYGYTLAWSDSLARGAHLGRSVITSGDFAAPGDLPGDRRADPLAYSPRTRVGVPGGFPPGLINRYTVGLANTAWYWKAPRERRAELQTITHFFHPLDGIRNWNRVYGPGGFRQYQYVLPMGQEEGVRESYRLISDARAASFVTVLKRLGERDPGPLSFPIAGWTLALDVPARTPGLAGLLARLDDLVAGAGGRVYLAKDSRVPAAVLARMYPELGSFRELRAKLDPRCVLASDLSRRLSL